MNLKLLLTALAAAVAPTLVSAQGQGCEHPPCESPEYNLGCPWDPESEIYELTKAVSTFEFNQKALTVPEALAFSCQMSSCAVDGGNGENCFGSLTDLCKVETRNSMGKASIVGENGYVSLLYVAQGDMYDDGGMEGGHFSNGMACPPEVNQHHDEGAPAHGCVVVVLSNLGTAGDLDISNKVQKGIASACAKKANQPVYDGGECYGKDTHAQVWEPDSCNMKQEVRAKIEANNAKAHDDPTKVDSWDVCNVLFEKPPAFEVSAENCGDRMDHGTYRGIEGEHECREAAKEVGLPWGDTAGSEWFTGCIINGGKVYFSAHEEGSSENPGDGGFICRLPHADNLPRWMEGCEKEGEEFVACAMSKKPVQEGEFNSPRLINFYQAVEDARMELAKDVCTIAPICQEKWQPNFASTFGGVGGQPCWDEPRHAVFAEESICGAEVDKFFACQFSRLKQKCPGTETAPADKICARPEVALDMCPWDKQSKLAPLMAKLEANTGVNVQVDLCGDGKVSARCDLNACDFEGHGCGEAVKDQCGLHVQFYDHPLPHLEFQVHDEYGAAMTIMLAMPAGQKYCRDVEVTQGMPWEEVCKEVTQGMPCKEVGEDYEHWQWTESDPACTIEIIDHVPSNNDLVSSCHAACPGKEDDDSNRNMCFKFDGACSAVAPANAQEYIVAQALKDSHHFDHSSNQDFCGGEDGEDGDHDSDDNPCGDIGQELMQCAEDAGLKLREQEHHGEEGGEGPCTHETAHIMATHAAGCFEDMTIEGCPDKVSAITPGCMACLGEANNDGCGMTMDSGGQDGEGGADHGGQTGGGRRSLLDNHFNAQESYAQCGGGDGDHEEDDHFYVCQDAFPDRESCRYLFMEHILAEEDEYEAFVAAGCEDKFILHQECNAAQPHMVKRLAEVPGGCEVGPADICKGAPYCPVGDHIGCACLNACENDDDGDRRRNRRALLQNEGVCSSGENVAGIMAGMACEDDEACTNAAIATLSAECSACVLPAIQANKFPMEEDCGSGLAASQPEGPCTHSEEAINAVIEAGCHNTPEEADCTALMAAIPADCMACLNTDDNNGCGANIQGSDPDGGDHGGDHGDDNGSLAIPDECAHQCQSVLEEFKECVGEDHYNNWLDMVDQEHVPGFKDFAGTCGGDHGEPFEGHIAASITLTMSMDDWEADEEANVKAFSQGVAHTLRVKPEQIQDVEVAGGRRRSLLSGSINVNYNIVGIESPEDMDKVLGTYEEAAEKGDFTENISKSAKANGLDALAEAEAEPVPVNELVVETNQGGDDDGGEENAAPVVASGLIALMLPLLALN